MMDEQMQNLIRALQEGQGSLEEGAVQTPPGPSIEPLHFEANPELDEANFSVVLQEVYHTSRFLQRHEPGGEGSTGFNITKHSILSAVQNPYMCSMCGAIFAFSGNLTRHIRAAHGGPRVPRSGTAAEGGRVDEGAGGSTAEKGRGRPRRVEGDGRERGGEDKENDDDGDIDDEVIVEATGADRVAGNTGSRPRRARRVPKRFLDGASDELGGADGNQDEGKTRSEGGGGDGSQGDAPPVEEPEIADPVQKPKKRRSVARVGSGLAGVDITSISNIYKSFPCEFCDTAFTNHKQRSHHRLKSHRDERFRCKVCGKEFALSKYWLFHRHCQSHDRPNKRKAPRQPGDELPCDICGTLVATASCLSIHKQNLHPEAVHVEKPFECPECGKAFRTKYLLKSHRGLVHTEDRPFPCDACGARFKTKQYLEIHSRVHTGEKPFECRFCGRRFRTNAGKRKHERTHTKERPYKCRFCRKDYNSKMAMSEHTTAAHTQDRPLMCEVCGKTFVHRASFRQHKFLHTGRKPHACRFCGRAFSQKVNLQDHVRSLHTHEKPYKCDLCGMSFTRSTGRNDHVRKKHGVPAALDLLDNFHTQPVEEVEISGLEVEF